MRNTAPLSLFLARKQTFFRSIIPLLITFMLAACGGGFEEEEEQSTDSGELDIAVAIEIRDSDGKSPIKAAKAGQTLNIKVTVSGANANLPLTIESNIGDLSKSVISLNGAGSEELTLTTSTAIPEDVQGEITASFDGNVLANANVTIEAVSEMSLQLKNEQDEATQAIPVNREGTVAVTLLSGEEGVIIEFSTDLGKVNPQTALTNEAGVASVTLTADGEQGAGVIEARVRGSARTYPLAFQFVDPIPEPEIPISLLNDAGESVQSVAQNSEITVQADIRAIANEQVIVEFETDMGELKSSSALSSGGLATVVLQTGSQLGAGEIKAKIKNSESAGNILFEVVQQVLPSVELSMIKLDSSEPTQEVSSQSPVQVIAKVVNNDSETSKVINFTSTLGTLNVDSVLVDASGEARIELYAGDVQGAGQLTAQIAGQENSQSINFQVVKDSGLVNQLFFVEAAPQIINLQGSGGETLSSLTFKLMDGEGDGIANATINFELVAVGSDATLSEVQKKTGVDGLVTINAQAGQVAAPVRVRASYQVGEEVLTTLSSQLVITTGIPVQSASAVAVSRYNIDSSFIDESTSITVSLADQFNNIVPDGTQVSFRTEAGTIGASCLTEDGLCSVNLRIANYEAVGEKITTNCFLANAPGTPIVDRCPGSTGNFAWGGLVSVVGFAVGEEGFPDLNGNGVLDTEQEFTEFLIGDTTRGEPFDLADAFVDFNDDGLFNPAPQDDADPGVEPDPVEAQEVLIDFNGNGLWDPADKKYNGSLCRPGDSPVLLEACPGNNGVESGTYVREPVKVAMSGPESFITLQSLNMNGSIIEIQQDQDGQIPTVVEIVVSDLHNRYLPEGTTIKFEGEDLELRGKNDFKVINSAGLASESYVLTIVLSEDANQGTLTVTTQTPRGFSKAISIPVVLASP